MCIIYEIQNYVIVKTKQKITRVYDYTPKYVSVIQINK
jgi:hypothetical protein